MYMYMNNHELVLCTTGIVRILKIALLVMYYTCTSTYMCCFALFVCLTLLASFFLPSHLSFKNMYIG